MTPSASHSQSASPPRSPPLSLAQQAAADAHAYASNGLEILQAASDAAQALQSSRAHALQHAAAAEEEPPGPDGPALPGPDADALPPPLPDPELPGANLRDPTINPKLTRLRRACDMCSMRKVKCDDSKIPCRPCRELGVDCTYQRETKRRGPPNKHAEAAKAAKRVRAELISPGFPASPTPQNAAKTLLDLSTEGVLDAEAIAPTPVLELLVDDFFTYIHPLAPFPHEPTFRQSFANREDRTKPELLGLLASMVAALVATFPRSIQEHHKALHGSERSFPRAIIMLEQCRDVALLTRGSKWVLKQPKTLDDAATSYFLGLASGYAHQWNAARYFLSETLTLIREMGFSRPKQPGELPNFGSDVFPSNPLSFNHVKDQIGKRIFWCLLLSVRSFSQLSDSYTDVVIAPSTPSLPYPAYPENVDDICILANEIMHPSEGSTTLLTGFRFAIDVYTTMNGVVSLELAYGMSTLPWPDQRLLLRDGLMAAKRILDGLPPELQLSGQADEASLLNAGEEPDLQYVPPMWPNPQPANDIQNLIKAQPQRKRQLQYEIQKTNIFISQLATRCYFVELFFDLRDVHLQEAQNLAQDEQTEEENAMQGADDKETLDFMFEERELIAQDLLAVLGSLSQRNLEPNGEHLVSKLRHVASTLVRGASERKGPFALKVEEALLQLVAVLGRLEKPGAHGEDQRHMTTEDEEAERQHWSDLRDLQLRFIASESFSNGL